MPTTTSQRSLPARVSFTPSSVANAHVPRGYAPATGITKPGLGITVALFNTDLSTQHDWGVSVNKIDPGSLAARSGLRLFDRIVGAKIGDKGVPINKPADLLTALRRLETSDKLVLNVCRGGVNVPVAISGYEPRGYLGVTTTEVSIPTVIYGGQRFEGSAPSVRDFRAKSPAKGKGINVGDTILAYKRQGDSNFTPLKGDSLGDAIKLCKAGEKITFLILPLAKQRDPIEKTVSLTRIQSNGQNQTLNL